MKRLILILCILALPLTVWSDDDWRPRGGPGLGLNATVTGGGVTYTLKDDFSIDVAAGSVNGTAAVPGPGTRTVTDSAGNKLSISGGNLVVISNAAGDPRMGYGTVTRSKGKMLLNKISIVDTTQQVRWGYDNDASGLPGLFAYYSGTDTLLASESGAPTVYSISDGTVYNTCLIMKDTGGYFTLKIGSNWYILYIGYTYNTSPVYPCISNNNASASIDFLRVPTYLWTPRPLSADDFGGTYPTLDNAVSTLTGLEAYQGGTKTWGDFLSGTGTTGAGVVWDHEWEFAAGSLADTGGTGGLTLTAGDTDTNTTDWANRTAHAKLFDGGDYFSVANNADVCDFSGNTYSLLCEFSVPDLNEQYIVGTRQTAPAAGGYNLKVESSLFYFYDYNAAGSGSVTGSSLTPVGNSMYQCIITRSGTTLSMYINGVLVGTGTAANSSVASTSPFVIGARAYDNAAKLRNGAKVCRVATKKGTALTPLQVMNEYKKWVATSDAGVYARFYGGPDPGANGLTNQAGAVTEGTWGSENAGESSYQAYAIRYKPTVDANPGNYDNSTSLLRRTGTWSISGGFAINAPVGTELVDDPGMTNGALWTCGADWDVGITTPGVATKVAGAAASYLINTSSSSSGVVGTWYRKSADLVRSAGAINMYMGNVGARTFQSTATIYEVSRGTGAGANTGPRIYAGNTFAGTIDNFSVKALSLNQLLSLVNTTGTPDVYAEVDVSVCAAGFQAGIALNWDSPTNPTNGDLIYLNMNDGKVYWDKCTNGTWANYTSGSGGTGLTGGSKLAVRKIGTSTYIWYNNAFINSYTTVNNPATTTPTYHGMFQTGASATETKLDNWKCYGVGSNGEYSILNAFIN